MNNIKKRFNQFGSKRVMVIALVFFFSVFVIVPDITMKKAKANSLVDALTSGNGIVATVLIAAGLVFVSQSDLGQLANNIYNALSTSSKTTLDDLASQRTDTTTDYSTSVDASTMNDIVGQMKTQIGADAMGTTTIYGLPNVTTIDSPCIDATNPIDVTTTNNVVASGTGLNFSAVSWGNLTLSGVENGWGMTVNITYPDGYVGGLITHNLKEWDANTNMFYFPWLIKPVLYAQGASSASLHIFMQVTRASGSVEVWDLGNILPAIAQHSLNIPVTVSDPAVYQNVVNNTYNTPTTVVLPANNDYTNTTPSEAIPQDPTYELPGDVTTSITTSIPTMLGNIWNSIKAIPIAIATAFTSFFDTLWNWLSDIYDSLVALPSAIGSTLTTAWNTLWDWLGDIVGSISALPSAIGNVFTSVWENFWEWLQTIVDTIVAVPSAIVDGIEGLFIPTIPFDTVIDTIEQKFNYNVDFQKDYSRSPLTINVPFLGGYSQSITLDNSWIPVVRGWCGAFVYLIFTWIIYRRITNFNE